MRWRQNSWDEVTQSTTINERHTPSQKSSSSDRDPELSSEEESNKYVLFSPCYFVNCFFSYSKFLLTGVMILETMFLRH